MLRSGKSKNLSKVWKWLEGKSRIGLRCVRVCVEWHYFKYAVVHLLSQWTHFIELKWFIWLLVWCGFVARWSLRITVALKCVVIVMSCTFDLLCTAIYNKNMHLLEFVQTFCVCTLFLSSSQFHAQCGKIRPNQGCPSISHSII